MPARYGQTAPERSHGFNAARRGCGMTLHDMTSMTGASMMLAKLRTYLIRGLAVVAVVLTYAVSGVGTVGITSLALTTTSTPAEAAWWWGRHRYYRRYWAPRRYWYRRRWW